MRRPLTMLGLALGLLLPVACGNGLGPPCDNRGSKSDCGPGQICMKVEGGLHCQEICDRDGDCAPGEECSGVSNSDEKACKPDDDGDFDDDDGDDGVPF